MALLFQGSFLYDFLCVILALFVVIYTSFKWTYGHWKRKNIKYMEPSFPLGNMTHLFGKNKISFMDRTLNCYNYLKDNNLEYFGLFWIKTPIFFTRNLEHVKHIVATDFDCWNHRGIYFNEADDPLSAHLIHIAGKKWQNLRTKLSPAFTSNKLKQMFKTMTDCTKNLEKFMEDNLKAKKSIDIKMVAGNYTTDVIGSYAFGIDCNSFEEDCLFRKYGNKTLNNNYFKLFFSDAWPELAKIVRLKIIDSEMSNFFFKIIEKTVQYRKKNNVTRNDFLQILIDLENDNAKGDGTSLTIAEMAAQAYVFFMAGFETSATTTAFALFAMSENQNIQNRVREEIFQVLSRHGGEVTYDSIMEMKYLEQVIQETLRKYPPASDLVRVCVEDYRVPGTDVILEKGTKACISVAGFHYDEEYFPNPHRFDPDRFSLENKQNIKPYTYIPFGAGRRICVGERFAYLQVKIGLVSMLSRYKFFIGNRTQLPLRWSSHSFILSAIGDIWLDYEKL